MMRPRAPTSTRASSRTLENLFPVLFGAFLGLTFLKFGNPPIMEKWVAVPANTYEFLLGSPWPITWGYFLLAAVSVNGIWSLRRKPLTACWPLGLLMVWLAWQFLATLQSVDTALSAPTLAHFLACGICFALGLFCLSSSPRPTAFIAGLAIAYVIVLAVGIQQQFGGLEQTRRYFFLYVYPDLKEVSPDYIKKMLSPRIFSTLFYPNTLAGAVILLFPPVLALIAQARRLFTAGARFFLAVCVSLASLACLVWSGSKGGWLLMLLLVLLSFLRLRLGRLVKLGILGVILVTGMVGFGLKYHSFFRKGATSVVARFDYWSAALETANRHPVFGTGPGTFAIPYRALKRPESEMARLVHNDYLEQASDSGCIGFFAYTGFIVAGLAWSYPRRRTSPRDDGEPTASARPRWRSIGAEVDWFPFAVWLGALGWATQSLFEFGLYIPALSWTAFGFLGWLVGRRSISKLVDNPARPR